MGVDEHTIEVAGAAVFFRRAAAAGTETVYLHTVPTSADDWSELLALTGGIAPDLPGFGRSSKAEHLDYSLAGYVTFLEEFLDALELPTVILVGHGWGAAIALLFAERHQDRVDRLAIIDALPLLPGFTWPASVRWLRRPGIGELMMGWLSRRMLARVLRRASATAAAWPEDRVTPIWEQFDQGTQRVILRLLRSVNPRSLAAAGLDLGTLERPVLVVWGERDPWLDPSFADAYARVLSGATVETVADAGHWPWLDRPELTARLAAFVAGSPAP
ncbi:MAG TPA: alpha/beta hydrolase [Solirubrobacteraceae bacterium]